MVALVVIGVVAVFVLILLASAIRILREYERGVIFRLGRLIAQKGPGLILLIPIIDQMVRIDLRTVTLNVPPQEVITKDNVTVRVNAVAYFRVIDPNKAITEVENFLLATSQIAQTTLRSVLGKAELDALLAERERLNIELQQIIDEQTEPWGIKVSTVEVKDVELPGRHAARDRPPGRGRARAAGEDHRRRRRVPGLREALPGGQHHQPEPGDAAAPLPADAGRDRRQQQHARSSSRCRSTCSSRCSSRTRPAASERRPEACPGLTRPRARSRRSSRRPTTSRRRPTRLLRRAEPLARGPDRPAHRPAGDPRPGPRRAPGRVRAGARRSRAPTRPSAVRSARAARTAPRPRSGPTGPAAAPPTRPAGSSARCRTSIRSWARTGEQAAGGGQSRRSRPASQLDRPARAPRRAAPSRTCFAPSRRPARTR